MGHDRVASGFLASEIVAVPLFWMTVRAVKAPDARTAAVTDETRINVFNLML